jgi:two-component system sensor histidine kinase KdpD
MKRTTLRSEPAGVFATLLGDGVLAAVMAPLLDGIGLLNAGLILLLFTLGVSATWGRRVGLFAALVANITLNFFFVEPLHKLTVQDPQNIMGLCVFLIVSVVGGTLLSNSLAAADEARRRASETQVLLDLSRVLIGQTEPRDALRSLCAEAARALDAPGAAVLSPVSGGWRVLAAAGSDGSNRPPDARERAMADHAATSGSAVRAGQTGLATTRRVKIVVPSRGTRLPEGVEGVVFVPLRVGAGTMARTLGILRLDGPIGETPFREHPERLLAAFAGEAALGVQRAELAQEAAHADALRQADEMKSALMASISHDLKTPLAGIKASISSLLDGTVQWSDEDRAAFLETIDSQADRLNRVITDILDLNRIESGVVAPAFSAVDVRALVEDARERTGLVTVGREVRIEAPEGMRVRADASLLAQALVNLIENAAKYSTPGGAIVLRASTRGADLEIAVEDEGPGIAPRDLPHVFERFYRATEQSRRVKGSGLGLAIVKGFVTLSGGSVRVESEPSGTRFLIRLPRAVEAAQAESVPA